MPGAARGDLPGDWGAELDFILHGSEGLPVTRLLGGMNYSADLERNIRFRTYASGCQLYLAERRMARMVNPGFPPQVDRAPERGAFSPDTEYLEVL